MTPYSFSQGSGALLISVPHSGTWLPDDIEAQLTDQATQLPDTDWFVPKLYDFADKLGASVLIANASRYVVDLNRPPNNEVLYPGQQGTGLFPHKLFDGTPLYQSGIGLPVAEMKKRVELYWRPYHDKLASELERIKQQYGYALLYDAHSIMPVVPMLFEGRLPDLNLGTAKGESCNKVISDRLNEQLNSQQHFTHVSDGRFVGGYITRHYGNPAKNVHAVQMELAQSTYMDTQTGRYDEAKADKLKRVLQPLLLHFQSTKFEENFDMP